MAVCSADGEPSAMRWQDVLDPVLDFARAEPEQIIVINLDLKEQDVETMEDDLDAVCKVHAERTEGTKLYEPREVKKIRSISKVFLIYNIGPVSARLFIPSSSRPCPGLLWASWSTMIHKWPSGKEMESS